MENQPNASRPRKCPDCRYLLRGLPATCRCPECGFEYDPHTTELWAPRVWTPFFLIPLLPLAFAFVVRRQNPLVAALLVLVGTGLLALLWYVRPRFVIAARGVRSTGFKQSNWIPWPKVANVTITGRPRRFTITDPAGNNQLWILVLDIGGRAFAERLKETIEAKRRVYSESVGSL